MRRLFILGVVLVFTGSFRQTVAVETGGARIEFREENFDFGEVSNDTLLQHVFVFANVGEDTLRIRRVSSG